MNINCPKYINTAIKLLNNAGFESFAVGGCIRDFIIGKTPNDWDMTTSSTPDQTIEVFKNYRIISNGLKHGTITVIIDSHPIEITTMRIDGEYNDSRHPENVTFTSDIVKDLSRRDFTVNAIAYNPVLGLIDPFNGADDIKRRIIRCVGNPDKRFSEDALRVMRAIRFSSVLGFDIEKETASSLSEKCSLLNNISGERIRDELVKLLQGQNVESVLTLYKDIIFSFISELKPLDGYPQNTDYHIYDIWTHTVKTVANVKSTKELRVAALLHDIGKPEMHTKDKDGVDHFKGHSAVSSNIAYDILKRLKFSNNEIQHICSIIELHDVRPDGTSKQLKRICSKYGIQAVNDSLEIMKADAAAKNPKYYDIQIESCNKAAKTISSFIEKNQCLKTSDLCINGNDVMALGARGKQIGMIINSLFEDVLDEKIENNSGALLYAAKKAIEEINS